MQQTGVEYTEESLMVNIGVTFRANLVQMSQANQVEMEAG